MAENLPANWQLTNWGNCGKFIAGTGFPKNQQGFKNYEIPFYKVGSLKFSDSNGYIYDNSNTINENIRQDLKAPLIPPNSVLFAKIDEAIRLNRRSLNSVPCCIDNNLVAFVSNSIFFKYAYYWSQTINLYDYARATTIPAIRKSDLENLIIPVPPIAEQKRIVALLDSLFEKLDAASDALKSVFNAIALHKVYLLKNAFDGALTAKFRANNGISKDDWQEKTLGEICKLFTGNSINEKVKQEKYFGKTEGLIYIATKDVGFDTKINYDTNIKIHETDGFKIAPANTALLCIEGGSAGKKVGFTRCCW